MNLGRSACEKQHSRPSLTVNRSSTSICSKEGSEEDPGPGDDPPSLALASGQSTTTLVNRPSISCSPALAVAADEEEEGPKEEEEEELPLGEDEKACRKSLREAISMAPERARWRQEDGLSKARCFRSERQTAVL